jgi:hypothetical protein
MITDFIRLARVAAMAGVLIGLRPVPLAQAQVANDNQGPGIVEVTTLFSESQSLVPKQGRPAPVRVELKEFHLAGHDVPVEIPEDSFYVAYLVWGNVRVQVGAGSSLRTTGDFWTVEKGARMIVTVRKPGEGALIQTFSVSPGG